MVSNLHAKALESHNNIQRKIVAFRYHFLVLTVDTLVLAAKADQLLHSLWTPLSYGSQELAPLGEPDRVVAEMWVFKYL